jgi:hypothetical protein
LVIVVSIDAARAWAREHPKRRPRGGNPPRAPADESETAFVGQQDTASSSLDATNVPSGPETSTATWKELVHETIADTVSITRI